MSDQEPSDANSEHVDAMCERFKAVAENLRDTEMLDSVVILATYRIGKDSFAPMCNVGNYYAACGSLRTTLKVLERNASSD